MEKKNLRYSINASAISRYANRNFDLCLRHLPISSGQQFFLLRIYENPGIPLNGLAQLGFFDKGTVSRGVQKLEEAGYITVITDEKECLLINKLMKQMVQNAQTYIAKKEEEVTCNKEH